MFKTKIFIFLILIFVFNSVNAASKYRYVCDNEDCYNTEYKDILDNYYMYPVEKLSVDNFSTYIDNKLWEYKDYYWDITFEIVDYYSGSWSIEDKVLTLSWLLNMNDEFYIASESFLFWTITIEETFDNWKDYLFDYFTDVIDELHDWLPAWDKKNKLSDILINILWYNIDSNKFNIKNICNNYACYNSNQDNVLYTSTWSNVFLSWNVKYSSQFTTDTFVVSNDYNISKLIIKAWESVDFNFWYEDYLDFTDSETEYEYKIYYNFDWDSVPLESDFFLKETIYIDNDTYEVRSDNIQPEFIDDFIDITVLDDDTKQIRVWVKEWITLSKDGDINFYLSAKNITSWESFPITLINNIPLEVLPNDDIKSWSWLITSIFTPELNSDTNWFNPNHVFDVEFNLYDEFLNKHFDTVDWYSVDMSAWSDSSMQLSRFWEDNFKNSLDWINTNWDRAFKFQFRFPTPGYKNLEWFNIRVKSKIDKNSYESPVTTFWLYNLLPSNLYDWWQKMNIYIKAPIITTLPVSCGQIVNVNFECKSDNFSGCDTTWDWHQQYTTEAENGTSWTWTIIDNANNEQTYTYTMNHVDKTAPVISMLRNTTLLNNNWSYEYIVNSDDLKFKFYEWTTTTCSAEVAYDIKVNWLTYSGWTILWENSEIIFPWFFETSWIHNLHIKATDKYWNEATWAVDFELYADEISTSNTTLSLNDNTIRNKMFANNSDFYDYNLYLKDHYWNPIKNKQILWINFNCWTHTWCLDINTRIASVWVDALDESLVIWNTDNDWKKWFRVSSLAPGEFSEVVDIKMHTWDNTNTDQSLIKTYRIWLPSDSSLPPLWKNFFKKPLNLNLYVSDWSKPTLWVNQKYDIELVRTSWNNLVLDSDSNWILEITKNSIVNQVNWHYWNKFKKISNLFHWNDLSTELSFSWTVDANSNVLQWISLSTEDMLIKYKLWGKTIDYNMDNFSLNSNCDRKTLWLKVIWIIQWDWKQILTGQHANFSDLTKWYLRSIIRKNAYKLIRNRESWINNINNVLYIKWNKSYSDIKDYLNENDTIIVEDWNFIIDENIDKNIWIIVLKSNYLVHSDYNVIWNIYILNNVTEIKALVYSDWVLRSAKANWDSYSDNELATKLTLIGSVFTRNTIWWAVRWGTNFTLPWWEKTTYFEIAQIYDLNYIRKVKTTCSGLWDYSFLIQYNPAIQIKSPKWFEF